MRSTPLVVCAAVLAFLSATPAYAVADRAHAPRAFVGMISGTAPEDPAAVPDLRAMAAAGVGTVRPALDAARPVAALDPYMRTAARLGLRVIPVLMDTSGYVASTGADGGYRPPPDPAAYARWAAGLVARYGPEGTLWAGRDADRKPAFAAWTRSVARLEGRFRPK